MQRGKFLLCAEEENESHPISTKLVTTTSYKLLIFCLDSRACGKQRDSNWFYHTVDGRKDNRRTYICSGILDYDSLYSQAVSS